MTGVKATNRTVELSEVPYSPDTILLGLRGSIAHGVYMASDNPDSIDDRDLMGIVVPPFEDYFSLHPWGSRGTRAREVMQGDIDLVEYEITKMTGLLLKSNPNVSSLLWMDDDKYLICTALGSMLRQNRDLFSSRRAIPAFTGYAHNQIDLLRRSTRHGFQGKKRAELIERFGYDTKNAAHAIRLLRMGTEFVATGVLHVDRTGIDADELLAIKQGKLSLEEVEKLAADHVAQLRATKESPLPDEPNEEAAVKMMQTIIRSRWIGYEQGGKFGIAR